MQQGGFHEPLFHAKRGTTRGAITSPAIFVVVVENEIRRCLSLTIDNPAATHSSVLEAVGHKLGVFYYKNGMINSCNSE